MIINSSKALNGPLLVRASNNSIALSSIVLFMAAIACQLTDVSLGPVKVWELMAISFFPFFIRKVEAKLLIFLAVFTLLLIISLLKGISTEVNFSNYGGLKSKYVISIVRYVELVLCLIVACLPFNFYRNQGVNFAPIVKKFLTYNALLTILILMVFLVDVALGTKLVSYGPTHRLRAFYVEGGPYGLFLSTLLLLEMLFFKRKMMLAIFAVALLLSQSKAGIVAAVMFAGLALSFKYPFLRSFMRPKNMMRFSIMILISALVGGAVMYKVAENYVSELSNINQSLHERGDDPSLVMGRIAATYIGPEIIRDNPLVGVGLGAYSLVRNDPHYRGPFPVVPSWDLTGLGGFFNLLIENGMVGVLLFLFATLRYYRFDDMGIAFLALFIIPFLLGAQLYMVYPWLYLGFYSVYRKEMQRDAG